jgi:nucleoside-diphosphate-sugar epimerase
VIVEQEHPDASCSRSSHPWPPLGTFRRVPVPGHVRQRTDDVPCFGVPVADVRLPGHRARDPHRDRCPSRPCTEGIHLAYRSYRDARGRGTSEAASAGRESHVHAALPSPALRAPRRALVTGVAGFVGSHLAETLVAHGHEVVGVDAFTNSYPRWYKERNLLGLRGCDRFRFHQLDLRTDDLDQVLEGVDTVFNEAAFPGLPRSWSELEDYLGCNLLAVSRLIDACSRQRVRRFVQASTSSVYGEFAVGDEEQPTRPVSPYGMTKLAAESLLLAHVHAHGFPAVILRYFSIYGPRQRPDMAYHIFIEALRSGRPVTVFGDGLQSRSNTFIADCVDGTLQAAEAGVIGEIYNIGGGVPLQLGEALRLIATAVGRAPTIVYADARPGDQRTTRADTAKAHDAFGYVPRIEPLEGLADQVRWHLAGAEGDRGGRWNGALTGLASSPAPLVPATAAGA